MISSKLASIGLAASLAVTLPAIPAHALVTRTFVSAAGSDSNNCANVATPCRHLAAAYAATAANGEIYVLDPANYGSLTITQAVSIEGHGWASIAPTSGNAAITINANPGDAINIIGVVLDGTAIANTSGIQFNSGGTLTVRDSVIRNFNFSGIYFTPNASSDLFVSDTLIAENSSFGIFVRPTGSGTVTAAFNRVEAKNNTGGAGIDVTGSFMSGGSLTANVAESMMSGNANGLLVYSDVGEGVTKVTLFHSVVANNNIGIQAAGGNATITVAQSAVTGSATSGWDIVPNAVIQTYQDNYFNGNATNTGSLTTIVKQ